jgi:hypothetical protein
LRSKKVILIHFGGTVGGIMPSRSAVCAAVRTLGLLLLQRLGLLLLLSPPAQFSPWLVTVASAQETEANSGGSSASSSSPPNILLFIVDDLGWNQVGYHANPSGNNEIRTPHIDAAAAAGIELNRGYVTPWYVVILCEISDTCACGGNAKNGVWFHTIGTVPTVVPSITTNHPSFSLFGYNVASRARSLSTGADRRGRRY